MLKRVSTDGRPGSKMNGDAIVVKWTREEEKTEADKSARAAKELCLAR